MFSFKVNGVVLERHISLAAFRAAEAFLALLMVHLEMSFEVPFILETFLGGFADEPLKI